MKAWDQFCGTPFGELLTGTAHQAHPTDITAPLGRRFAGTTILAVHVALEKAATVRVTFDRAGEPHPGIIRNIRQRNSAEFTETLRAEAGATGAEWALLVLATGWQAVLGQRAARPDAAEPATAFSRHRLMFETPEVVVPRCQLDRVYTAVDHPLLDRSVVFSLRRRELEELLEDVRKAGLDVAGVRVTLAAQLECWLAAQGEAGLARDLLVSDGLCALLLNVEQGDFVPPRGAVETEQPRQSSQRPSAIEEDITRFVNANRGRAVTFLGPEELCAAVKRQAADAEIVRPQGATAHDVQRAILAGAVRHDLQFEARAARPAVARTWRRWLAGYGAAAVILAAVAVLNGFYALRVGYDSFRLERDAAASRIERERATGAIARITADLADADAVRSWAARNYHVQPLAYRLLQAIPASAALERLAIEMRDGQVALTFVVTGDQDTQLRTHRAVEAAISRLRYKIGSEELPTAGAGVARAIQYRMHVIVPEAAEANAS